MTGANEYLFRIFNPQEGYDQTFTRSTYILQLNWNVSTAPPLMNGSTYSVEVNVGVNGAYSGFCGNTCTLTIATPAATRPESMVQADHGQVMLWPNPVRDGQVNLSITGLSSGSPAKDLEETNAGDLAETLQQIVLDVQDIYGKQVFSKAYSNSGDRFSTVLELPSDIASGVYMVSITVNGERSVKRLSIIR